MENIKNDLFKKNPNENIEEASSQAFFGNRKRSRSQSGRKVDVRKDTSTNCSGGNGSDVSSKHRKADGSWGKWTCSG